MSRRLATTLLVGCILLGWSSAAVGQTGNTRTWQSTAGTKLEAAYGGFASGQVSLECLGQGTIQVPIEQLAKADQEYVAQRVMEELSGREEVSVLRVVTTGVGVDPDKALLNALSHAIEQAVGVLVDSETLIEQDQIVRDRVLTATRGDVEFYSILDRWKADGLHHTRVWAFVSTSQLGKKLEGEDFSVRAVPGDRLWARLMTAIANEDDAVEMFDKIMEGFKPPDFVDVEPTEDLEVVSRDAGFAKVRLKVRITPKMRQWEQFLKQLEPFLDKVSSERAKFIWQPTHLGYHEVKMPVPIDLQRRLQGDGILLATFLEFERKQPQSRMEAFRVPGSLLDRIEEEVKNAYRLVFVLLDSQGNVVERTEHKECFGRNVWGHLEKAFVFVGAEQALSYHAIPDKVSFLAPTSLIHFSPSNEFEKTLDVEIDTLRTVSEYSAFLEPVGSK